MHKDYHILAKKSIFSLILVIILVPLGHIWAKTPNDPEYQQVLYDKINAPAAWEQTTGSHEVVVAVLDTGTDIFNPDLNDNIWKNDLEIENNGKDDDRNGFVDDYFGWNFVENNNDVITRVDNTADDPNAVSHGTVIAGLIGAIGNNGLAGTGVNWQVKIMPLRVVNNDGSGTEEDLVKAVNYAIDKRVDVISMSFVTDDYLPLARAALRRAYDQGIVIVASAGNDGVSGIPDMDIDPKYPICLDEGDADDWIIGVTSVDMNDHHSFFADYGNCVDLTAPGENIFSTERYVPVYGYKQEFGGPWKGTSFAAPLVAGAAALLKSVHPSWKAPQIVATLLANADNIDALNVSLAGKLGSGRLNIGRTVASAPVESSKPVIITNINHVFTFSHNQIFRDGRLFFWLDQSQVLALATADVNNDSHQEVVILHELNGYYFLRLMTTEGIIEQEFSLGSVVKKNIMTKRLMLISDNTGQSMVAVGVWNPKSKITTITKYDFFGHKLGQVKIKAKLLDWSATVEDLTTTRAGKKGKITEIWDWTGKKI